MGRVRFGRDKTTFGIGFWCGPVDYESGYGARFMFLFWNVVWHYMPQTGHYWHIGRMR